VKRIDVKTVTLEANKQSVCQMSQSRANPTLNISSSWSTAWTIFLSSLVIRWVYSLLIFASMGEAGLKGADSYAYIGQAHQFATAILGGSVHGLLWFGPNPAIMPLFTWLLTANALLFGNGAPLTYVLMQGVIDAGTCLIIYRMAQEINPRYALPAAIAAAINPTQIVLSGLVYTDTLFVFFVALFLYSAIRWLRTPSWNSAIWLGIGLGVAAMVRVLIAPWSLALALFLLASAALIHRFHIRQLAQIVTMMVITGSCVASISLRNVTQYNSWALTSQFGDYYAMWVVPLVIEAQNGTPWQRSYQRIEQRTRERFGPPHANPFEESRRHMEIGREEMATLDFTSLVKAYAFGVAINLGAPAIILSPPISQLPRTGFYGTVGNTLLAKVGNFLFRSDNAFYAWALLLGIAGVAIVRAIQLCGCIGLLRGGDQWPVILLFAGWFVYVLAVNGPIASPKYRLPVEPLLCVLTGAGFCLLRTWRKKSA
jgi:4-amino-4-deoxy-L-arabinose transferase-like glycosyltransferase